MLARTFRDFTVGIGFLGLLLLLAPGCASTSKGLRLFPQGNRLTDAAKEMRSVNAQSLAIATELDKQPTSPYVVEPGDVLLVQPADLDSPVRFPGDQPILPDGTINLGKYGHLEVMGKTVAEIEGMVKAAVAPDQGRRFYHGPASRPPEQGFLRSW